MIAALIGPWKGALDLDCDYWTSEFYEVDPNLKPVSQDPTIISEVQSPLSKHIGAVLSRILHPLDLDKDRWTLEFYIRVFQTEICQSPTIISEVQPLLSKHIAAILSRIQHPLDLENDLWTMECCI